MREENHQITVYLRSRLEKSELTYLATESPHELLRKLYDELNAFDFENYKKGVETQIEGYVTEWWSNEEKGIVRDEELYAILFEYGYYFTGKVDAAAYGISKWKDYTPKTEMFDMGYDYDFATEFYACPGIDLTFYDNLSILDWPSTDKLYPNTEIDELPGYYELLELYQLRGMMALHEVFLRLEQKSVFNVLNCKEGFMFIIDEHDSGEVYPLLIR